MREGGIFRTSQVFFLFMSAVAEFISQWMKSNQMDKSIYGVGLLLPE